MRQRRIWIVWPHARREVEPPFSSVEAPLGRTLLPNLFDQLANGRTLAGKVRVIEKVLETGSQFAVRQLEQAAPKLDHHLAVQTPLGGLSGPGLDETKPWPG